MAEIINGESRGGGPREIYLSHSLSSNFILVNHFESIF